MGELEVSRRSKKGRDKLSMSVVLKGSNKESQESIHIGFGSISGSIRGLQNVLGCFVKPRMFQDFREIKGFQKGFRRFQWFPRAIQGISESHKCDSGGVRSIQ